MANLKLRPYHISPFISVPLRLHLWPVTDIPWLSSDAIRILISASSTIIGNTLGLCRVNIRPFLFFWEDTYKLRKLSQSVTSVSPSEITLRTRTNSSSLLNKKLHDKPPVPLHRRESRDLRRVRGAARAVGWTRGTYPMESNLEISTFSYKLDSLLRENTFYF